MAIPWKRVIVFVGTPVLLYFTQRIVRRKMNEYYLREKKGRNLDVLKINKLLTFGISFKDCDGHRSNELDCGNLDCNYGRLYYMLSFIDNAKKSVDISIYIITAKLFENAIINAHRRGVRVRVIADSDMSFSAQSSINNLRLEELPVRQRPSPFIMHHKFIIVDDEVLLNGSMNFTMTGAFCNWDNVLITTQPSIVTLFCGNFKYLWDEFAPGNTLADDTKVEKKNLLLSRKKNKRKRSGNTKRNPKRKIL